MWNTNGARPKSQPSRNRNNEGQGASNENSNTASNERHIRDLSILLRDSERMKTRISALQNQLMCNNSGDKNTNSSLLPQQSLSSENDENPVNCLDKDTNIARREVLSSTPILTESSTRPEASKDSHQPNTSDANNIPNNQRSRATVQGRNESSRRKIRSDFVNQEGIEGTKSFNSQQLSRKEIELLYSEMRKLQQEIEQHRSRFQENLQSPTVDDLNSSSESDVRGSSSNNLNESVRRAGRGNDDNIKTSNGKRSLAASRDSSFTQHTSNNTSYLLGPDLLTVETETINSTPRVSDNVTPRNADNDRMGFTDANASVTADSNTEDPDTDIAERNLALLTAQYEKSQEDDFFHVPPAMSLFNNWNQIQSSSASVNSVPQGDSMSNSIVSSGVPVRSLGNSSEQIGHQMSTVISPLSERNQRRGGEGGRGSGQVCHDRRNLESQIQEQRDELARLIQKARCSPNMNEWHQQASATINNSGKNVAPRVSTKKAKNLDRRCLASVNIPPTMSVAETPVMRAGNDPGPGANQMDQLNKIMSELHRLAAQMERISPAISSVTNTNLPPPASSSVTNNNTPHSNYPATLSFSSAFARNQQLINSLPQNDLSTRTSDSGVLREGGQSDPTRMSGWPHESGGGHTRLPGGSRSGLQQSGAPGRLPGDAGPNIDESDERMKISRESQLQQLTISINQIYQVFFELKRDMTRVVDRVSSLELQMTAHDRMMSLENQLASSSQQFGCFPPEPLDVSFGRSGRGQEGARCYENNVWGHDRNLDLGIHGIESYTNLPSFLPPTNYGLPPNNDEHWSNLQLSTAAMPPNLQLPPSSNLQILQPGATSMQLSSANTAHIQQLSQTIAPSLHQLPSSAVTVQQQLPQVAASFQQLPQGAANVQHLPPNGPAAAVNGHAPVTPMRSDPDSGVSSGTALNNQVSPGMRANNYYDNFRSFSRQNRLDSLNNLSPPDLQNQAFSHQYNQPQQHLPQSHGVNLAQRSPDSVPANNAASSYVKTRKKHKINREQNRNNSNSRQAKNSTNLSRDNEAAAGVFSRRGFSAQRGNGDQSAVSDSFHSSNVGVGGNNHSSVDNISKNIYSQIESLITSHEKSPEFLADLLEDLTLLGSNSDQGRSVIRGRQEDRNMIQAAVRNSNSSLNTINTQNRTDSSHKYDLSGTSSEEEREKSSARFPARHNRNRSVSKWQQERPPPSSNLTAAATPNAALGVTINSYPITAGAGGVSYPNLPGGGVDSYPTPSGGDANSCRTPYGGGTSSYSTPIHNPMDGGVGSNSLTSLEGSPLTNPRSGCNVITPNPGFQRNNSNTKDTLNSTPMAGSTLNSSRTNVIVNHHANNSSFNSPQNSTFKQANILTNEDRIDANSSASAANEGRFVVLSSHQPVMSAGAISLPPEQTSTFNRSAKEPSNRCQNDSDLDSASTTGNHSNNTNFLSNQHELLASDTYSVPKNHHQLRRGAEGRRGGVVMRHERHREERNIVQGEHVGGIVMSQQPDNQGFLTVQLKEPPIPNNSSLHSNIHQLEDSSNDQSEVDEPPPPGAQSERAQGEQQIERTPRGVSREKKESKSQGGEASSVEGQVDNNDVEELAEADQAHSDPQGSPQQAQGSSHAFSQVQQNVQVSPRFHPSDIPGPTHQLQSFQNGGTEQNSINRIMRSDHVHNFAQLKGHPRDNPTVSPNPSESMPILANKEPSNLWHSSNQQRELCQSPLRQSQQQQQQACPSPRMSAIVCNNTPALNSAAPSSVVIANQNAYGSVSNDQQENFELQASPARNNADIEAAGENVEPMNGLDRVPIRLPSSQALYVEAQRQIEEDMNAAALINEALSTSPSQLAHTESCNQPPMP